MKDEDNGIGIWARIQDDPVKWSSDLTVEEIEEVLRKIEEELTQLEQQTKYLKEKT